jgi:predicted RNase H-like HicB family nuclease
MKDITFIVREDDIDGGFAALAHWPDGNRDMITEGETREQVIANISDAVRAAFNDDEPKPDLIHLHFVRDEVIARCDCPVMFPASNWCGH